MSSFHPLYFLSIYAIMLIRVFVFVPRTLHVPTPNITYLGCLFRCVLGPMRRRATDNCGIFWHESGKATETHLKTITRNIGQTSNIRKVQHLYLEK